MNENKIRQVAMQKARADENVTVITMKSSV